MRYGQIRKYDVAKVWDEAALNQVISYLKLNEVEGLTILGGEPFESPEGLLQAIIDIRKQTDKSIWVYSGFKFEVLEKMKLSRQILEQIDVLVDGEFIEEYKDLTLDFRGSSNQRIIDVKSSLKYKDIILVDGYK